MRRTERGEKSETAGIQKSKGNEKEPWTVDTIRDLHSSRHD